MIMRHPEAIKLVRGDDCRFYGVAKTGPRSGKEGGIMTDLEKKSIDPATIKMIQKAAADGCETIFDRAEAMKPCPIGAEGSCCKNCAMGPCRVPAPKKKEGVPQKKRMGLCGATAETIAARNFARMVAAGTAAHSDHARGIAEAFLATAKGEMPEFKIKDEQKLYQLAMDLDVEIGDRSVQEIAIEVGQKCLAEFGRQHGEVPFIKRAPAKRQEIWRKLGIVPRGIDREVVELMHRTHMGVDQDYQEPPFIGGPLRSGRRVGRFHDFHGPAGYHVRQSHAGAGQDQSGRAEKRSRSTWLCTDMNRSCRKFWSRW